MGRHSLGNSLKYFSLDVDIFRNRDIKLLNTTFGSKGIVVYIFLLTCIYEQNGYYIEYDDEFEDLSARELCMKSDLFRSIVNYCVKRGLFDNELFNVVKVLSSQGIQERFQLGVKTRALKNPVTVNPEYWLLKKEDTQSFIKFTQKSEENNFSEKNRDNSRKNADNSEKYDLNKSKIYIHSLYEQPTLEQVEKFCREEGLYINPKKFYYYYEANGWMQAGCRIADWRAKAMEWNCGENSYSSSRANKRGIKAQKRKHGFSEREVTSEELCELEKKLLCK